MYNNEKWQLLLASVTIFAVLGMFAIYAWTVVENNKNYCQSVQLEDTGEVYK